MDIEFSENNETFNPTFSTTQIQTVHDMPAGGTTGQVLTKETNQDFDTIWQTIQISQVSGLQSALNEKGTYSKPAQGIPSSDMTNAVRSSLNKADNSISDAPSDNKQYARKNGDWSEVEASGGTSDFDSLTNRPSYNGQAMTHATSIPEVKTATWDGKYSKPSGGIPSTDMTSDVQTSLEKADSALQQHQSLAGYATQAWVNAQGFITSLVGYATEAWVNAKNYATQTWVEAKGYLTEHQSLAAYRTSAAQDVIDAGKQDKLTAGENITIENNVISASGGGGAWGEITGTLSDQTDLQEALDEKQDELTAGSNISIVGDVISAILATQGDTMFGFDVSNGNLYLNATDTALTEFTFSIDANGNLIMEYEEA